MNGFTRADSKISKFTSDFEMHFKLYFVHVNEHIIQRFRL